MAENISYTTRQGMKTRKLIMQAIISYMMTNGYPPSEREIGEANGISSVSAVHRQLNVLHEMGKIQLKEGSRAIVVPGIRYINERFTNTHG